MQNKLAYNSSSTQFNLPQRFQEDLIGFSNHYISDEDLYTEDDKKGRETEFHVTLFYGIDPKEDEVLLEDLTNQFKTSFSKPIYIELGKINKFRQDKYDVLKIEVKPNEILEELHNYIKDNYENHNEYDDYNPHITLAYVKKDTCENLVGDSTFDGKMIKLTKFKYSPVDGKPTFIQGGEIVGQKRAGKVLLTLGQLEEIKNFLMEKLYTLQNRVEIRNIYNYEELTSWLYKNANLQLKISRNSYLGQGFMIDPLGNWYDTKEYKNHTEWAKKHINMVNSTQDNFADNEVVEDLFLEKGWVKLSILSNNSFNFEIWDKSDLSKVENILLENPYGTPKIIIIDILNIPAWMKFTWEEFKEKGLNISKLPVKTNSIGPAQKEMQNYHGELLNTPEHQALQESEPGKTNVTNENELTMFPKKKHSNKQYEIILPNHTKTLEALTLLKSLQEHKYDFQVENTKFIFNSKNDFEDVKQLFDNNGLMSLTKKSLSVPRSPHFIKITEDSISDCLDYLGCMSKEDYQRRTNQSYEELLGAWVDITDKLGWATNPISYEEIFPYETVVTPQNLTFPMSNYLYSYYNISKTGLNQLKYSKGIFEKEKFEDIDGNDEEGKPILDIGNGDLVDFGPYGNLYVVKKVLDDTYWVTDKEEDRENYDALGWSIKDYNAEKIIEKWGMKNNLVNKNGMKKKSELLDPELLELLKEDILERYGYEEYYDNNLREALIQDGEDVEQGLKQDILDRYNNDQYWNQNIIDEYNKTSIKKKSIASLDTIFDTDLPTLTKSAYEKGQDILNKEMPLYVLSRKNKYNDDLFVKDSSYNVKDLIKKAKLTPQIFNEFIISKVACDLKVPKGLASEEFKKDLKKDIQHVVEDDKALDKDEFKKHKSILEKKSDSSLTTPPGWENWVEKQIIKGVPKEKAIEQAWKKSHPQKTNYEPVYPNKDTFEGVDPIIEEIAEAKYRNSHYRKESLVLILKRLKNIVSPEGWEVILNFAKKAIGWNRWNTLEQLYDIIKNHVQVNKSWLRSYTNTDLEKLFETGDLSSPPTEEDNKFFENKMKESYSIKNASNSLSKEDKKLIDELVDLTGYSQWLEQTHRPVNEEVDKRIAELEKYFQDKGWMEEGQWDGAPPEVNKYLKRFGSKKINIKTSKFTKQGEIEEIETLEPELLESLPFKDEIVEEPAIINKPIVIEDLFSPTTHQGITETQINIGQSNDNIVNQMLEIITKAYPHDLVPSSIFHVSTTTGVNALPKEKLIPILNAVAFKLGLSNVDWDEFFPEENNLNLEDDTINLGGIEAQPSVNESKTIQEIFETNNYDNKAPSLFSIDRKIDERMKLFTNLEVLLRESADVISSALKTVNKNASVMHYKLSDVRASSTNRRGQITEGKINYNIRLNSTLDRRVEKTFEVSLPIRGSKILNPTSFKYANKEYPLQSWYVNTVMES